MNIKDEVSSKIRIIQEQFEIGQVKVFLLREFFSLQRKLVSIEMEHTEH